MQSNTATYQTSLEQKRDELLNRAHKREDIHIEQAADKLDELQLQLNRELVIRELQLSASILRQVESALARIESGSFGICLGCDGKIPPRRLAILPCAAYCVVCQEHVDRFASEHITEGHLVTVEE